MIYWVDLLEMQKDLWVNVWIDKKNKYAFAMEETPEWIKNKSKFIFIECMPVQRAAKYIDHYNSIVSSVITLK
jgi:hypothetical protein